MFYKVTAIALLLATAAAAAQPIEGVWRRGGLRWDVKHPGKQLEVKVTAMGGNTYTYTAAPDGKEYPVTGFMPKTTVKLLSVSDHGFELVMFLNGKEFSHTRNAVTQDGKLLNSDTSQNGSSSRLIFAHY
jgi:hypothetical protein